MKIQTRFGTMDVEENRIIRMPGGMIGFSARRFILCHPDKGGPFCWLQAVDDPALAFVVVDPSQFFPDYTVRLTREESDMLLLEPDDEVTILSVVTMGAEPSQITANLQGPIVINPTRMIARQLVLEGGQTTRLPLFGPPKPVRVHEAGMQGRSLLVPPSPYPFCPEFALACA